MQTPQNTAETKSNPGAEDAAGKKLCAELLDYITEYEEEFAAWERKADKVVKRYADIKAANEGGKRKYNILWSNVETLKPALYFSPPKVNIERRYKDKDPVGRVASDVLERSTEYFIASSSFHDNAKNAVQDRLLPGRGLLWVRYVPHFRDATVSDMPGSGPEITEDADADAELVEDAGTEDISDEGAQAATEDAEEKTQQAPDAAAEQPEQEVEYEEVAFDYVHWKDFGHILARVWGEVPGAWRKVYLDRRELVARFGKELGNRIPLDHQPQQKNGGVETQGKKATIYEFWFKTTKQAVWLHKSIPEPLDVVEDPLEIDGFFPFPKPLFATLTTDSLIPTPDYIQYQDQARELDELTARISSITKSLRVAGIYDSTAEGVQNLLSEGLENKLIAVKSWAIHSEKGGLAKAVEFLPIEVIANVLMKLYEARDKVKADLNEITGIADIIRGNSDPDETAEAQHIKGNFATLRLSDMQNNVREFIRETVQIGAEVIAKHFSPETLKMISGVQLMTKQEKQQWQMMQTFQAKGAVPPQNHAPMAPPAGLTFGAAASQPQPSPMQQPGSPLPHGSLPPSAMPPQGAPGQPPAPNGQTGPSTGQPSTPPPPPPEGLNEPSWEEVMALLRNNAALCFKMDIETDSTIKQDQDAERKDAMEFVEASATAIQQISQVQNPALGPLIGEILMFAVRRFKNARSLESVFEETIKKMKDAPPAQPPSPEMIRAQTAVQIADKNNATKLQAQQMQAQADATQSQAVLQKEQMENQGWMQHDQAKLSVQQQIAQMQQRHEDERTHMKGQIEILTTQMKAMADIHKAAAAPKPAPQQNGGYT